MMSTVDDQQTCGGTYKVTVSDGVYEVRCTRCGYVTAAGPASDRHFFAAFYRHRACERRPDSKGSPS